jgi:alpha-galactosidase
MKKLHHGLKGIADYSNKKDLKFGLWFEPEMVNENSALYETHPDWVIRCNNRDMSYGRNQLVLDLSRTEVQEYIISSVNNILDSYNIEYVKWDMNRHISDMSSIYFHGGELSHRYMIGLYKVFEGIIKTHPNVFFEGCASGGNRFDLGILCYFDQIWTSDDTDAYERISIQSGYALAYPLKTLSNHVSAAPSHSVLRNTSIDTRFNVAMFGSLGYELDLSYLESVEKKAVYKYCLIVVIYLFLNCILIRLCLNLRYIRGRFRCPFCLKDLFREQWNSSYGKLHLSILQPT